ncbi:hypothetical protein Ctob_000262 [Chrysochromulina tobinii]|uniref:Uncharacterized protein n=1 Tax=Chrysochromulina tobinii TaxID=1460289 RepID=A0A0M0JHR6_9EUKA|nr:hypothetical protein Ctob_000262 [Chrysochromulina tobinii]|eukprot:KOO25995.1 hypothetical protein Ctob_000262 [Chrysochromulina sp. CCMP291]
MTKPRLCSTLRVVIEKVDDCPGPRDLEQRAKAAEQHVTAVEQRRAKAAEQHATAVEQTAAAAEQRAAAAEEQAEMELQRAEVAERNCENAHDEYRAAAETVAT